MLAEEVQRGVRERKDASTYQVMVVRMALIRGPLQLFLLATPLPPKDLAVALIIRVYRLHQRVNGCEEAG
jgi:hypothetical protein